MITAPGKYGPHTVGPMMNPDPPMILFVPDVFGAAIHRSFVSSAGVLRIVGAVGAGGGSRVLGEGCGDKPGIFR